MVPREVRALGDDFDNVYIFSAFFFFTLYCSTKTEVEGVGTRSSSQVTTVLKKKKKHPRRPPRCGFFFHVD